MAVPILALAAGLDIGAATEIVGPRYEVRRLVDLYAADLDLTDRKVLVWPAVEDAPMADAVKYGARDTLNAKRVAEVKYLDVGGLAPGFGPGDAPKDWEAFREWATPRVKVLNGVDHDPLPPAAPAPTPPKRKTRATPPPAPTEHTKEDGPRPPPEIVPVSHFPWEGRAWGSRLIVTDRGKPKPCLANAITALSMDEDWKGVLAFDEFAFRVVAKKPPPIGAIPDGSWSDIHDIRAAEWLQRHGIDVSKMTAGQAASAVAAQNPYHPVRDYLSDLKWDGVDRCEHWLIDYCGAKDSPYVRAVSRIFLVGAVARIFRPGCQLDTAMILEGAQGKKKSSVLRALFDPWFTDDMADIGSKDAKQEVGGVWGLELPELSQITRGHLETVKAFLTRRVERFRPPFGAHIVERARQSVFCGTSNNFDYLKDDENRRFLPVRTSGVSDAGAVREVRDQLWAEATARFRRDEKWWIEDDNDLLAEVSRQQEHRRQADEWENAMAQWINGTDLGTSVVTDATLGDFMKDALGMAKDKWGQVDQNRVARILKSWGWKRYKKRLGSHSFQWRYRAPSEPASVAVATESD